MILATFLATSSILYPLSAALHAAAYAMLLLNDTSTVIPVFLKTVSNSTSPADPMADKRSGGEHQWKLGRILFWLLLVAIGVYLIAAMARIVLDKHGISACDLIRRLRVAGPRRAAPQTGNGANATTHSFVELIFPANVVQSLRRLHRADPSSILPSHHQTPRGRTPVPNLPNAMAIPLEARHAPPLQATGLNISVNVMPPRSVSPSLSLAGSEWSDSTTIAPEPDQQPRRPFFWREGMHMPA